MLILPPPKINGGTSARHRRREQGLRPVSVLTLNSIEETKTLAVMVSLPLQLESVHVWLVSSIALILLPLGSFTSYSPQKVNANGALARRFPVASSGKLP